MTLPLPVEPGSHRTARRLVTIPLTLMLSLLGTLSLALLPVTLLTDAIRGRTLSLTRFHLFVVGYLGLEVAGLVACGGSWLLWRLTDRTLPGLVRTTYRVQQAWLAALAGWFFALFSLRLVQDESSDALPLDAADPRPWLVLMRHGSLADILLPSILLSRPHGVRLRYVLKRELMVDPAFDLAGNRMPNAFVDRRTRDPEREREVVARLARGIRAPEGVIIYPEGTLFTPERRDRLRAGPEPLSVRAGDLQHLLPPRPGGTLALMRELETARVVVLGHHGFEGARYLRDLLLGRLVGATIRVRFEVHDLADLPVSDEERGAWLDACWRRMDAWLDEADSRSKDPRSSAPPVPG